MWLIVASFFGFGVLLTFTPCVLPMIPILSGIIVGQGAPVSRGRAFSLAAAYVLGMAFTYTIAGVIAGLSGSLLSSALQNPWVLSAFALIFVMLALSMFDVYELQVPASLQIRFGNASNKMQGGRLVGVTGMGALSALIVGPCVAAPLAAALLYLSQSRDALLGGTALFAMALGMGTPLLLIGLSAGELLPKVGAWMNAVKRFFGFLLLGVAIWLIMPVIPATAAMLLWASLLIVSAMFLRALDPLPPVASDPVRLGKGAGILALVAGIALLVGALSGSEDVLQPLASLRSQTQLRSGLHFQRVQSNAELDRRLEQAAGKYVMLDFYADWCVACKEMERFTFTDPQVQARLKDVVLLQADVTANKPEDIGLLKRFGLFGPPGIILFDRSGAEVKAFRVIGYQPSEQFLVSLSHVSS